MPRNYKQNFVRVFGALLYRDVRFVLSQLPSRLLDGFFVVAVQTLAIGSFLPLLGMSPSLTGPLYIGTMTQIMFSTAFTFAFRFAFDLKTDRFIEYELTLPLPKLWVVGKIIVSFMIQLALIGLPLIFLGTIFLNKVFSLHNAHWGLSITMYFLTLLFYSLLFIYMAFNYSYAWFTDNAWARRLTPLFLTGSAYFTWYKLFAFNKFLAYFLLINPLTYVHEGLRAALLGQENFLPIWICIPALMLFCGAMMMLLNRAVNKRLDPVL
jgi:ABC-2 type transport system permease protein